MSQQRTNFHSEPGRKRSRVYALAMLALVIVAACQTKQVTLVPQTSGVVTRLAGNTPVEGAVITVAETQARTLSGPEGGYSLASVTTKRTSAVLPVSGVYRTRAILEATTGDARGYGPADYISVSSEALHEVEIFLLPANAAYDEATIPDGCELPDQTLYALQLLQAAGPLGAAIADTPDYGRTLTNWLDYKLVRELPRTCELPLQQQLDWMAQIDALEAAL